MKANFVRHVVLRILADPAIPASMLSAHNLDGIAKGSSTRLPRRLGLLSLLALSLLGLTHLTHAVLFHPVRLLAVVEANFVRLVVLIILADPTVSASVLSAQNLDGIALGSLIANASLLFMRV